MNENYYYLEDSDIGKIKVIKKKGIKNFNIRLKPFEPVTLTAPNRASKHQINDVILRKKGWIIEKQKINSTIENTRTTFDQNSIIKTYSSTFKIKKTTVNRIQLHGSKPDYTILVPLELPMNTPEFQENIREIIHFVLRSEAKYYLPKRVEDLAKKYDFRYGKLTFRNNKSRWGSCSNRGNISLNIHLMRLPEHCIDYIIIHELCHTKHPNHGPGFKNLLYTIMPEAPKIEKEMRNYRTQIY
ncbi:MAG: M48 family peptidase [Salinivirgaceae bacterium]|nr:MAG: M48 family peptidase [Salinivirgaceae bacterium]